MPVRRHRRCVRSRPFARRTRFAPARPAPAEPGALAGAGDAGRSAHPGDDQIASIAATDGGHRTPGRTSGHDYPPSGLRRPAYAVRPTRAGGRGPAGR